MSLLHGTWLTNAHTRLAAANLAGGNLLDDADRPTRDEDLPVAHVSIANDQAKPDGDPRTGDVGFIHVTTLTVTVLDVGNTGADLKAKLVVHAGKIFQALCPDLFGWFTEGEGLDGVMTEYEAPPEGGQVTGRVIVAFQLLSRTNWPAPEIEDMPEFTELGVDAGDGIGADIDVPQ